MRMVTSRLVTSLVVRESITLSSVELLSTVRITHVLSIFSRLSMRIVIKSGGYKISALDIEREILGLDYVAEVMVVGVEDEEFGHRVAAAIVLQPDVCLYELCLQKLTCVRYHET